MVKLFSLFFLFCCTSFYAQAQGVELQLESNIIMQDGIELDITSAPIEMNNPCANMAHNPASCSYDSSEKIMTVAYTLDISPLIPNGKKGILNIDINNNTATKFDQLRLLDNGIPVASSLEFINNNSHSYAIEFKIKINGDNVVQQPQASINFILEEQLM